MSPVTTKATTTKPISNKHTENASKRGERLRFLRKITGMVTEPFGKLCGVGRTTISSWEQGINILTERGAEKVVRGVRAEGIQCTTFWLLHGIGEPPKIVDQDKLSKLHYDIASISRQPLLSESINNYGDSKLQKEIECFKQCYSEHLVYQIADDAMHPNYPIGNWVGGIVLSQEALNLAHDVDCIAELKNGLKVVRRVKIETISAFKISLYGINPHSSVEHPPFRYLLSSQITALAPIIRVWKKHLA